MGRSQGERISKQNIGTRNSRKITKGAESFRGFRVVSWSSWSKGSRMVRNYKWECLVATRGGLERGVHERHETLSRVRVVSWDSWSKGFRLVGKGLEHGVRERSRKASLFPPDRQFILVPLTTHCTKRYVRYPHPYDTFPG